ncbi:MAG TPA: VOC family protein [Kofleriaceae bacterium]|nr:VOC family protein [Kofleriaceae bacterium]
MTISKSDPGRFVWYELLTTEPEAAIAFYTDVVGWKTQPFDGGPDPYTMWLGSQGAVGGVVALPEQARKLGARPYWQANVEVADVDASIEEVVRLGGKVIVAETVPDIGRFAVIADPQGAVLALFTPARDMASHDPSKPGEVAWHELYTTDHEAAFAFYHAICGWERLGAFDMGPMGTYLLWGRDGKQLGGMMTMPPGMKTPDGAEVPPNWMYYVTVDDLDAALERAKAGGAKVINGPMEVPGGQRVVLLFDPQGAAFSLITRPAS